jgi:hypothetical protein
MCLFICFLVKKDMDGVSIEKGFILGFSMLVLNLMYIYIFFSHSYL